MDPDALHTIEEFYGVYLLYCTNSKYEGRTYVGYTVDPNRRIKQHNRGKHAGGAWRTSNRGPWSMVLIIHGFPNDIAALRFEWAWQHPNRSRRLNHLAKRKTKELSYDYHLRVLAEMLRVGPWNRLSLTIRWLNSEYAREFPADKIPPMHMPVCYGPVICKKLPKSPGHREDINSEKPTSFCMVCFETVEEKPLTCLSPDCDLVAHIICLGELFKTVDEYVPIEGDCPRCGSRFLWGDIIRKYRGCYRNSNLIVNTDMEDDFPSSESE